MWALPLSFAIPFPAQTAGLAIPVIEITREGYQYGKRIASEIDRRYAKKCLTRTGPLEKSLLRDRRRLVALVLLRTGS